MERKCQGWGAIEYIDLGKAKIDNSSLQGEFDKNRIVMFALNLGYQF
jgi:hypothetical protein